MSKISAIQPNEYLDDVPSAVSLILDRSKQAAAQGASLVCFPECYLQGYIVEADRTKNLAISLDSDEFASIIDQLREIPATIVFGMIEKDRDSVFNSAVALNRGTLLGVYRKVRLLPGELKIFTPATDFPIFEADGLTFGISICYDLNFSECAMRIAQQGAQLLVCPCNNMLRRQVALEWKDKHNDIRSHRCRESGVWLLSSDVTGQRGDRVSYGPTAVIDPLGKVVAQARPEEPGFVLYEMVA